MQFRQTSLSGAWIVGTDPYPDERGYFARLRCAREFAEAGLPQTFVQTNISFNKTKGTFRGLHYQVPPSDEGKLVRCISGVIQDVIVDLRPSSDTFLKHEWFTLDSKRMSALFVPPGFGHGFLTEATDTTVLYEMTDYYAPDLGRGIRWSDPLLNIEMPARIENINERDAAYSQISVESLACFKGPAT